MNPATAWPKAKLGDHIDLLTGFPFKSQHYTDSACDIPLLRGYNVVQGAIRWEDMKRWPASEAESFSRYALRPGDVVLAMDRPWIEAGLKYAWITERDCPMLLVQRVARLRGSESLTTDFLRYVVADHRFSDYLQRIVTGVSVPHISATQIRAYEFRLPPLPTQRKIVAILSAYDDLIENNTRRIAILEEIAQNLYREWFVHFRFPSHEDVLLVNSPLGPIPEGWDVVAVGDIVKRYRTGMKYNTKTVVSKGKVPVLDQGRSGIIGFHNDEPGFVATEDNPVIAFANHTCYQRIVLFPFSTIQNVIPFRATPGRHRDIYWLHWATKDLIEFNDYKGHWPEFMTKQLPLPPAKLCTAFGDCARPIVLLSHRLEQRNSVLRCTRDLLLPRLVSGQLDVSHLPIDTGDLQDTPGSLL